MAIPAIVSATVATYYPMTGGSGAGSTTEASSQSVTDSMTLKKISIKLVTAPAPRAAPTLRVNGADTGLTCTVVDTNTGCSFAADVAVADNDLLDTSDVPTGSRRWPALRHRLSGCAMI